MGETQQQALTLVPLSLYFKDGRAKVPAGPGPGPQAARQAPGHLARDAEREAARAARDVERWRA